MSHPSEYKAFAFHEAHKPLQPVTVPWKDPQAGQIVIKVLACGVCAGDEVVEHQYFPTGLPRIPGHEIVGDVYAVPSSETKWKVGDRVGAGWHGGHCFDCAECKKGHYNLCSAHLINGVVLDGGFAEYATVRTESVVPVPSDIDPAEAAPLLCAGVTVYNSLRNMSVEKGETVAVQGIGGLGHLGLQFSNKLGFKTVALSSSASKEADSIRFGATKYLDGSKVNQVEELKTLGGAKVIMCCAPDAKSISSLVGALANDGTLLLLAGTAEPLSIPTMPMLMQRLSVRGWPSGTPKDSEETITFAKENGIKVQVTKFSLDQAQEAYDHRSSAKYRAVIIP